MFTRRMDLDHVLHDFMVVGFGALLAWSLTGLVGTVSGYLTIQPQPTLRFLLTVIVLVFARRWYWQLRRWRWKARSPEERFGFTNPVWETPRSSEIAGSSRATGDPDVTEPPQPQG